MRAAILVLLVGCSIPDKFLVDSGTGGGSDTGVQLDGPEKDGPPIDAAIIPKRVFVTQNVFHGAGDFFGGVQGADNLCMQFAGPLGGQWKAWISDPANPVQARFNKATVPYVDLNGTTLADNFQMLMQGTLRAPLVFDENKNDVRNSPPPGFQCNSPQCLEAWTATGPQTQYVSPNCNNWQTLNGSGFFGRIGDTGPVWTAAGTMPCQFAAHLYCFEQ